MLLHLVIANLEVAPVGELDDLECSGGGSGQQQQGQTQASRSHVSLLPPEDSNCVP